MQTPLTIVVSLAAALPNPRPPAWRRLLLSSHYHHSTRLALQPRQTGFATAPTCRRRRGQGVGELVILPCDIFPSRTAYYRQAIGPSTSDSTIDDPSHIIRLHGDEAAPLQWQTLFPLCTVVQMAASRNVVHRSNGQLATLRSRFRLTVILLIESSQSRDVRAEETSLDCPHGTRIFEVVLCFSQRHPIRFPKLQTLLCLYVGDYHG